MKEEYEFRSRDGYTMRRKLSSRPKPTLGGVAERSIHEWV